MNPSSLDLTGLSPQITYLQQIINNAEDGDVIEIPFGTLDLEDDFLHLDKPLTLKGDGTVLSKAKILIESDNVTIEGFKMIGTIGRDAINVVDKNNFNIKSVDFSGYRTAVEFGSTILSGSSVISNISDVDISFCTNGIIGKERGEYVNINDATINKTGLGISIKGGNVGIYNPVITRGTTGIEVLGSPGTNDSHGQILGGQINHMAENALFVDGINTGHTIAYNHIIDGGLYIKDSDGVVITGGQLDCTYYRFENAIGTRMNDITFLRKTSSSSLVDKNYGASISPSVIIAGGNYNRIGVPFTDI